MLIGFVGDDFTGSVDALLQFRRTGLRGVLVTDVEQLAATDLSGVDVVGIATVARSLSRDELTRHLRPAFEALGRLGADVVQYKVSSTADSSPDTGSIGAAIELGREVFGEQSVAFLVAQPDFGRFTAFSTHFAADASGIHRLDRHPTMSNHPVTPMGEADLTRLLGAQTSLTVGRVTLPDMASTSALPTDDVVVIDAMDDSQLRWAGAAVRAADDRPSFVVGSGGLSRGIGLALHDTSDAGAGAVPMTTQPAGGPVLAVSGSCSPLSWTQVQQAVDAGWVGVHAIHDPDAPAKVRSAIEAGRSAIAYSATPDDDCQHGPDEVTASLIAAAEAGLEAGPARLVIAGGDTSGRVVRGLGIGAIEIVATPWGNTTLCRASSARPELDCMELILKGGQMGPPDLFERVHTGHALIQETTP